VPALVPNHRVPGDADAGAEGAPGEAEPSAHGRDPLRQAVEVAGRLTADLPC
jgi:hypothetical protein